LPKVITSRTGGIGNRKTFSPDDLDPFSRQIYEMVGEAARKVNANVEAAQRKYLEDFFREG